MVSHLPFWISISFLIITVLTVVLFYKAHGTPKKLLAFIIVWGIFQSILAYIGFYENVTTSPPRFGLVLLPILLFIGYGLLPKQRNAMINRQNISRATSMHSIRIAVELILLQLFIHKLVPELMTFEGRNFDIIAGLSAPIMAWLFHHRYIGNKPMLYWNFICLFLVCFIMTNGILSTEMTIQQFGFDQPNRAVMYFPFILLPAIAVPLVIYTHIISILKLQNS